MGSGPDAVSISSGAQIKAGGWEGGWVSAPMPQKTPFHCPMAAGRHQAPFATGGIHCDRISAASGATRGSLSGRTVADAALGAHGRRIVEACKWVRKGI